MTRRIDDVYRTRIKPAAQSRTNRIVPKEWHGAVFDGLPPLAYYSGNYRGYEGDKPCLFQDVTFGTHRGCPRERVRGEVVRYLFKFSKWIELLEDREDVTRDPARVAADRIAFVAFTVAMFLKIHPFINGNGRVSRLLTSFLLMRFGMPPMQEYPRPADDYVAAVDAAMRGDYAPLQDYILLSAYPKRHAI